MTVPKWLSFLSSLHPVYQQSWPPGMPVHTPLLSDWCFFPKVLSMLLSAHGFSHNKSWTHHGKNRVYAIWNHTRQLLLSSCSSNYIPHFSCISLFGPQAAPTNSGQPGESGNAFRRGNLQCGCEGRWGPHSLQLTPPFFYQNTRTTDYISDSPQHLHISVLSVSGIFGGKQRLESQNCGHWTILILMSMKTASKREHCASSEPAWLQTGAFPEERSSWFAGYLGFSSAIYYKALTPY